MIAREETLLDDAVAQHLIKAQLEDLKVTCNNYIFSHSTEDKENNDLLNKLCEVRKIHDKFARLEQAFGHTNFTTLIAECEHMLADTKLWEIMSIPRNNHLPHVPNKKPEETGGAQLITNLKTKLANLREAYLDIYIPETLMAARQQFVRKLKIKADELDNILQKGYPSFSYQGKQVVLSEIKELLDPIDIAGDITTQTIDAINCLHENPVNRTVMLSHTLGFIANSFGLRPTDAYMAYFKKQTEILEARMAQLNYADNLVLQR